jgi:mono/diheme cytochrome c family protein
MSKRILIIPIAPLLLLCLNSCNPGAAWDNSTIPSDSITIAKGEASFMQNCSGCHNFRHEGIGPSLGGLTAIASADWIGHFIRDPKKMIESGDERAGHLFKKYKVAMPSFITITDDEMNGIIAFLHTHKKPDQPQAKGLGNELLNPIPDSIKLSNLVLRPAKMVSCR